MARFLNRDVAFPALMSAHRLRAALAMALRPAALSFRFGFARAPGEAAAGVLCVPGGRPRRFPVVPPRASMARFSLSRSANNNARICFDISSIVTQTNAHGVPSSCRRRFNESSSINSDVNPPYHNRESTKLTVWPGGELIRLVMLVRASAILFGLGRPARLQEGYIAKT